MPETPNFKERLVGTVIKREKSDDTAQYQRTLDSINLIIGNRAPVEDATYGQGGLPDQNSLPTTTTVAGQPKIVYMRSGLSASESGLAHKIRAEMLKKKAA